MDKLGEEIALDINELETEIKKQDEKISKLSFIPPISEDCNNSSSVIEASNHSTLDLHLKEDKLLKVISD